jgi:hypothetical protein
MGGEYSCMGDMRNGYKILVGEYDIKRLLIRSER